MHILTEGFCQLFDRVKDTSLEDTRAKLKKAWDAKDEMEELVLKVSTQPHGVHLLQILETHIDNLAVFAATNYVQELECQSGMD